MQLRGSEHQLQIHLPSGSVQAWVSMLRVCLLGLNAGLHACWTSTLLSCMPSQRRSSQYGFQRGLQSPEQSVCRGLSKWKCHRMQMGDGNDPRDHSPRTGVISERSWGEYDYWKGKSHIIPYLRATRDHNDLLFQILSLYIWRGGGVNTVNIALGFLFLTTLVSVLPGFHLLEGQPWSWA